MNAVLQSSYAPDNMHAYTFRLLRTIPINNQVIGTKAPTVIM